MIAKEVFYQRSGCVGSRHMTSNSEGTMTRLKKSAEEGSAINNQGLPEKAVRELVKIVEEDPGEVVGLELAHGGVADLVPVLLSLYANGIAVRSVTANGRAFFLEMGKIDKKELEDAAMDYSSEFINRGCPANKGGRGYQTGVRGRIAALMIGVPQRG
jgi:hypothetical protein